MVVCLSAICMNDQPGQAQLVPMHFDKQFTEASPTLTDSLEVQQIRAGLPELIIGPDSVLPIPAEFEPGTRLVKELFGRIQDKAAARIYAMHLNVTDQRALMNAAGIFGAR